MLKTQVIEILGALAQETRLDIFRCLIQEEPQGLPAGKIGERLNLPSNTLAFHLKTLKQAGLVYFKRQGRFLIYHVDLATANALLSYLTENCCRGSRPR